MYHEYKEVLMNELNLTYEDVEGIAGALLAVFFILIEKFKPAREMNKMDDFKYDLLGFLLIPVVVGLSRNSIRGVIGYFNIESMDLLSGYHSGIKIFLSLLITDLFLYLNHRLMHTDFLWNAHVWHHMPKNLYWFSGFRSSFIHAFMFAIPGILVGFFLFNLNFTELCIAYSYGAFAQFFTHANIKYKLQSLSYIIVTPHMHSVHHQTGDHTHKNFGVMFSCWDRLFGTYLDPDSVEHRQYGSEKPENVSLIRILLGM